MVTLQELLDRGEQQTEVQPPQVQPLAGEQQAPVQSTPEGDPDQSDRLPVFPRAQVERDAEIKKRRMEGFFGEDERTAERIRRGAEGYIKKAVR